MMSRDYFLKFSVKYQPKHVNKTLVPCSCPLLPPKVGSKTGVGRQDRSHKDPNCMYGKYLLGYKYLNRKKMI